MIETSKKIVDFAHLVTHLGETLKSLSNADEEQKQRIHECIEQLKLLASMVKYQEKRLELLEARLLTVQLKEVHTRPADSDVPLLPEKKRVRRASRKGTSAV